MMLCHMIIDLSVELCARSVKGTMPAHRDKGVRPESDFALFGYHTGKTKRSRVR